MRALAPASCLPPFAQPTFLELTKEDRREACRELGHEYLLTTAADLFTFEVCVRCGALPYSRGGGR